MYGAIWFLRKVLKRFYQNHLNKHLFLHPIKASYEIWFKFAQPFFSKENKGFVAERLVHCTLVLEAPGSRGKDF